LDAPRNDGSRNCGCREDEIVRDHNFIDRAFKIAAAVIASIVAQVTPSLALPVFWRFSTLLTLHPPPEDRHDDSNREGMTL